MKRRVAVTFIGFCIAFAMIVAKAFYVQIINSKKLISYSDSQYIRKVKRYPKRGQIVDRNHNPLAINVKTYGIFSIPKNIKNKKKVIRKLVNIVPSFKFQKIYNKIKNRDKYTWISRKEKLEPTQVEAIKKLDGIYLEEQASRFYPNNELASQLIGFVGIDNEGLSGVEYSFDKKLKGEAQIIKYVKDAKGRPIKFETMDNKLHSEDIVLSIDKDVQAATERFLKQGIIEHKAQKGGAAVIDVETGEIWAMANYPTYDPNKYSKSKITNRRMAYVTDPFEPGSVLKTFTIAAALEENIVNPKTNYYCERGRLLVNNHIINEAEGGKGFEWLSISEILSNSSNIGTTKIAFDLTFPKLDKFYRSINIGKKTNIEIPGESRGIYNNKGKITPLTLSNISFGQGVATTAIQVLSAYAAVANGGEYIEPTLIKDKKNERRRVMKKTTANQLESMLVEAVYNGTGSKAKIPHFVIAGKTSTAQKPSPTGGYKGYVPGFVGYPINVKKRFAVFVYIDSPQEEYYGNKVAAPVFRNIVEYILYKNKEFQKIAKVDERMARRTLDKVKTINSSIYRKGKIDFIGLDKKSARAKAKRMGLDLEEDGFGLVNKQVILKKQSKVKLFFKAPQYE
jgi:cell division protein FtsI/penicillin-binding protein 2